MNLRIEKIKDNPVNSLRRAGYIFQRKEGEEMIFIRPFSASGFPRFHIYAKIENFQLMLNIHLDVKKETYSKETRHHGEYKNEGILAEEVERIKKFLE